MSEARVIKAVKARVRELDGLISVRRALPTVRQRSVGPFVFLDQMGPMPFSPGQGLDIKPHPHIGLATVTYLYEGALTHRDSLGHDQVIRPGDVNWMTAGRGIVHSERTEPSTRANGGTLFGVQAWVALPKAQEEGEPRFDHHPRATLPLFEAEDARIRVLAGSLHGQTSPVRFPTEITYVDVQAKTGGLVEIPCDASELAVYVTLGALDIGAERYDAGDLCVLDTPGTLSVRALTPSRFLVLGGAPLDGPRHIDWNFVSSQRDRIQRAKEDWRRGRFDHVPGETERVPLPEDSQLSQER